MGCQSSGKSLALYCVVVNVVGTLLNLAFGTQFDELDATRGRQMTTKGVWLGSSPKVKDVLILDLEGTDSSTRGDDRGAFERQSALFALAITEVLIINMWQSDIGRYVAANYGVLSNVFDANLQLFAHQTRDRKGKTILLFMIRDHDAAETPMETIESQIKRDVGAIWDDLKKPEEFKTLKWNDLFELQFYSLPHKKFEAEGFSRGVDSFRDRFLNEKASDYIFNTEYHTQKSVPIQSFGVYLHNIWNSIKEHKDLNIPSERKMLAIFRCDDIMRDILSGEFKIDVKSLLTIVNENPEVDFQTHFDSLYNKAIDYFSGITPGYDPEVVAIKRAELEERLQDELKLVYLERLSFLRHNSREKFQDAISTSLPKRDVVDNFSEIIRKCRNDTLQYYSSRQLKSTLSKAEWPSEANLIEDDLARYIVALRSQQFETLESICSSRIREELSPKLVQALTLAETDMWEQIAKIQKTARDSVFSSVVNPKLKGLNSTPEECKDFENILAKASMKAIFEEAKNHAGFVKMKMHQHFDKTFRFTSSGLPRRWKPNEDVRAVFDASVNLVRFWCGFV